MISAVDIVSALKNLNKGYPNSRTVLEGIVAAGKKTTTGFLSPATANRTIFELKKTYNHIAILIPIVSNVLRPPKEYEHSWMVAVITNSEKKCHLYCADINHMRSMPKVVSQIIKHHTDHTATAFYSSTKDDHVNQLKKCLLFVKDFYEGGANSVYFPKGGSTLVSHHN